MIFPSTTGLQIKAYGGNEFFKTSCLSNAERAASNPQTRTGAFPSRLAMLLNFTDLCEYEYTLGIPVSLALTLDYFASTMDAYNGADYLLCALEAIQPGTTLSHALPLYLAWFLDDNDHGLIRFAERRTTGSAIRKVAVILREGIVSGIESSVGLREGDEQISRLHILSSLEGAIARAKASALESLDVAENVPEESAHTFTTDSLVAGIAEHIALLAKKLLLDGHQASERATNRFLVTESHRSTPLSSAVPSRFIVLDAMAGSIASTELWTRIVILMQKMEDISASTPEQPFSILTHAKKFIELLRAPNI